jgi:hypothetical protein
MEYGNNLPGPYRIDVAVLDPDDIATIVHPLFLQNADNKYLTPLIGVEFFTEKSAHSVSKIQKHLADDAKKARECVHGFVVNVFRNTNWARRSQGRATNTFEKLKIFQSELRNAALAFPDLTWVGMVIHVALGEVAFFTVGNEWTTIDVSSGSGALLDAIDEKFHRS